MARILKLLFALTLVSPLAQAEPSQVIGIGVLSHRGHEMALSRWIPTADYLSKAIPAYRFQIIPLGFDEVEPAVAHARVDFVLVNPAIYVNLAVRYRVSRIATMRNRVGRAERNVFGGVIFTRADETGIQALKDLPGHSFAAVDPTSLGGFQMAWGELAAQGINPYRDFRPLYFTGTHDAVVMDVLRGKAAAGTVRTDILERMAAGGHIKLKDLRVLHPQRDPDFPIALSTPLYPEWPFSKLRSTPDPLAQQVAIALLQMPRDDVAARAGEYAGWTIPLDYQSVHRLLETLHLPPYANLGRFTLRDAVRRYWVGLLLGGVALLVMAFLTAWVLRLNKRLKRAKARIERQQQLVLNSVGEGIYGVGLDGRTRFVNAAMERITGWRAEDLIGLEHHQVMHHTRLDGSQYAASECPVYATFRDDRPRFVDDDLFWRKDGTSFPVEYSSNPIHDETGKTVGAVVVFRDMTERREAAEKLRRHQLELAHVARLSTLGEMASGIAHELNQPLTAITANARACVRLLETKGATQEYCSDVLDRIAAQAERAGEIIRHIRHFVRKEEPDIRPARLTGMLETVIGLVRPEAQRAGVTLTLDLTPDAEWVLAQEIQIEQVIINLARNAIEAMAELPDERRHLTLRARRLGAQVEIQVRDTGPGLDSDVAERVFEPFVTTKAQGMGLGLSISSGIVAAHGGQLVVDSVPGGGATFSFNLPLAGGEQVNGP